MKYIGTISRGIKAPIIRSGDDLVEITVDSIKKAVKEDNIVLHDKDIVAVTEAVVAKSQGNFAKVDDIAKDVRAKLGEGTVGLIFPILSRNRFSNILKGIAKGCDKIILQLSYPFDEVGNPYQASEEQDSGELDELSEFPVMTITIENNDQAWSLYQMLKAHFKEQ